MSDLHINIVVRIDDDAEIVRMLRELADRIEIGGSRHVINSVMYDRDNNRSGFVSRERSGGWHDA